MSETRALDEPLTDAELDELEGFLASDAVPEDCMDLEMLDGFLAAIVSGPESVQPSEWLPQVWSDGGRSAASRIFVRQLCAKLRKNCWSPVSPATTDAGWPASDRRYAS